MNLTHRSRSARDVSLLPTVTPPSSSSSSSLPRVALATSLCLLVSGALVVVLFTTRRGDRADAIGGTVASSAPKEARQLGDLDVIATTDAARAAGPGAGAVEPCVDTAWRCSQWAAEGECQRNPPFMSKECKAACGLCDTRSDASTSAHAASSAASRGAPAASIVVENKRELQCHAWALSGECEKNKDYMLRKCRQACERAASSLSNQDV